MQRGLRQIRRLHQFRRVTGATGTHQHLEHAKALRVEEVSLAMSLCSLRERQGAAIHLFRPPSDKTDTKI